MALTFENRDQLGIGADMILMLLPPRLAGRLLRIFLLDRQAMPQSWKCGHRGVRAEKAGRRETCAGERST